MAIKVRVIQGHKHFSAYPFDAYIGEVYGKGRKYGYYIQLARGTTNLNRTVGKTTFKTKSAAEKVIRKWLNASVSKYNAEQKLKKMKGMKRRRR